MGILVVIVQIVFIVWVVSTLNDIQCKLDDLLAMRHPPRDP